MESDTIKLLIIALLIVINAYFVILEFALVQVRISKIDTLVGEGDKRAKDSKFIKENLNTYLSATQLGITLVGLFLGWLGEPTISSIIRPALEFIGLSSSIPTVSIIISFGIITMLEVVIGELVPKTLALYKAEEYTLALAKSLIIFHKVAYPVIWTFDKLTSLCLKLMGLQQLDEVDDKYSKTELEMLVRNSIDDSDEKGLLVNAFKFSDVVAEDIIVHRLNMVCISVDSTQEEILDIITNNGYTRYPVTSEDKDHIIGYVHVRTLYRDLVADGKIELDKCIRPVKTFLEGTELTDIFVELKKSKEQLAIIVDEEGGTSGLLTLEDIIEQLVGNISDEFDVQNVQDNKQGLINSSEI